MTSQARPTRSIRIVEHLPGSPPSSPPVPPQASHRPFLLHNILSARSKARGLRGESEERIQDGRPKGEA
eukprot:760608-Hanusia_phi.AAC.1